jgi:hypothetical protein
MIIRSELRSIIIPSVWNFKTRDSGSPPTGAGFAPSAISNRDDSERRVWDEFWEA